MPGGNRPWSAPEDGQGLLEAMNNDKGYRLRPTACVGET